MNSKVQPTTRFTEFFLLALVFLFALLGFALLAIGMQVKQGANPLSALPGALLPPLVIGASSAGLHVLMRKRGMQVDQLILPVSMLLFTVGLLMIWRLQGAGGAWQQLTRGYLPGMAVIAVLIIKPRLVERMRRWAIPICLMGLLLLIVTAFLGVMDESGARLALQLGALPPIQPSEVIKLSLVIFLAWYIDREGRQAEGRARPFLGWLRLPPIHYFIPGILFVVLATLALVKMSDFGAVLILAFIFAGMLFTGFETRIFATISAIGLSFNLARFLVLIIHMENPNGLALPFPCISEPVESRSDPVAGANNRGHRF